MDRSRFGRLASAALLLTLLLASAWAAAAQEPTAVLRGVVTDTAGNPVPYALVRILAAASEQFTTARGGFGATGLAPGPYRVQVRQVGFLAFDSVVTLAPGGTAFRIVLRPLAIRLDELAITAPGRCTDPGPPDSASSPELAAIFAQLRENARRYAVLADAYPFRFRIERTFNDLDDRGALVWSSTDTVEFRSDERDRYRPGDAVVLRPLRRGVSERVLRLPTLPDIADSAFHAYHCFAFGGVREQRGERLLRMSFRAYEWLSDPDIEGEADLDPDTYQLRYLTFRLTRPSRALRELRSLSGTMTMLLLHPNLVVPGSIRSTQVSAPTYEPRPGRPVTRFLEHQRLVRVDFLKPLPADSTPSP